MTRTLLILSIIPSVALAHKRIIGGSEVAIEDLPYQVNILVYGTFAGGGSIVDETHILTAAHCVSGSPMMHIQCTPGPPSGPLAG
jgi:secreted trypsin-like serine protease